MIKYFLVLFFRLSWLLWAEQQVRHCRYSQINTYGCLNIDFICRYLIIINKVKYIRSGSKEIVVKKCISFSISHRGVWILLGALFRAQVCLSGTTKMFSGFIDIFHGCTALPYSSASIPMKCNGKCTFKWLGIHGVLRTVKASKWVIALQRQLSHLKLLSGWTLK